MNRIVILPVVISSFLILSFLVTPLAIASDIPNTYYVAPWGCDCGSGLEHDPWYTIGWAIDQACDGDTLRIMDDDDEYTVDYEENLVVDKPLTIESYPPSTPNPQVKASAPDKNVFKVTSDHVTIRGLDIFGATGSGQAGIHLFNANHCTIENNRCGWDEAHANERGIAFYSSSDNIIVGNTCSYNKYYGIRLCYSCDNNLICFNELTDNALSNAFSGGSSSTWYSLIPVTYEYRGATYRNYLGNYYGSEYLGIDLDNDGIGDTATPHNVAGVNDNYPLVDIPGSYIVSPDEPWPPIPELPAVALFSLGLVALAGGLMVLRQRHKQTA